MVSALLWYDLYAKILKSKGFVVNTYDRCIANSTIYVKQCIISWYVKNNKVLHIDECVDTRIIEAISEHFGEPTVSRGNKHKILGVYKDFLGNRRVSLFMRNYMEESITSFV